MINRRQITPEELEQIERYILKDMAPGEFETFDEKMQSDDVLQEKVQEVHLLFIGVQEAKLVEKLDEYHKKITVLQDDKSRRKIISFKRVLMAAALIALIAAGVWLITGKLNGSSSLYSEFYKADRGLITAMSTSDNYTFDRAMIDYKTADYEAAIDAWKTLLTTNPSSDTLNYFIGSAYLAKGEAATAIPYFEKVVEVKDSYFYNDAQWYLGLALVKENKKHKAIKYIEQTNHERKPELLKQLTE